MLHRHGDTMRIQQSIRLKTHVECKNSSKFRTLRERSPEGQVFHFFHKYLELGQFGRVGQKWPEHFALCNLLVRAPGKIANNCDYK